MSGDLRWKQVDWSLYNHAREILICLFLFMEKLSSSDDLIKLTNSLNTSKNCVDYDYWLNHGGSEPSVCLRLTWVEEEEEASRVQYVHHLTIVHLQCKLTETAVMQIHPGQVSHDWLPVRINKLSTAASDWRKSGNICGMHLYCPNTRPVCKALQDCLCVCLCIWQKLLSKATYR